MKRGPFAAGLAVIATLGTMTAYAAPSHSMEQTVAAHAASASGNMTLNIGISADPPKLDPSLSSSLYDRQIMFNIYDTLFQITPQNKVVGDLVQTWSISADGKTYTLHLRKGVKFQDGTPLNAAAVKFNFDRNMLPISPRHTDIAAVSSVDAPNSSTVILHLSRVYSPLMTILADRAGMMVSPTAVAKEGTGFLNNPVGSGPFKFKERVVGDHITLVKNPLYWNLGVVHFNTVVYKVFSDPNVELANLESGAVQLVDTVPASQLQSITHNHNFVVSNKPGLGWSGFNLNTHVAPFNNEYLRAAVNEAIDRQALVTVAEKGVATAGNSAFSPASPVFNKKEDTPLKPNSALVKQDLAKGGAANGFSFTFQTNADPVDAQIAQVIQSMLGQYGIQMKISQVEFGTLLANATNHAYQASALGWSGRFDPDQNITPFTITGGSQNYSQFSNGLIDELLKQAAEVQDMGARAKIYSQVSDILHKAAPYVYLFHLNNVYAFTTKLHGFSYTSDGVIHLAGLSLSK